MGIVLVLAIVVIAIGAFVLRKANATPDRMRSAGDTGTFTGTGFDSAAPMGTYDAAYGTPAGDDRPSDTCNDTADASSWDTCDSTDSSSADSSSSDSSSSD